MKFDNQPYRTNITKIMALELAKNCWNWRCSLNNWSISYLILTKLTYIVYLYKRKVKFDIQLFWPWIFRVTALELAKNAEIDNVRSMTGVFMNITEPNLQKVCIYKMRRSSLLTSHIRPVSPNLRKAIALNTRHRCFS